ncbi:MAG: carbohydrate ABC transporter permease, partial [Spirochaetota bacterium]|nr:carbohydrate ABC transporter permease [Spirochaetota bacterium]
SRRLKRFLVIIPAAVQLMTGGPGAVPGAMLYLLVLFSPFKLSWVIGVHTLVTVVLLAIRGFPAGLQPALAAAVAVWIVQSGRNQLLSPGPGRHIGIPGRVMWRGASGVLPAVLVLSAAAMGAALLWLSFSGVDAVTFSSLLPPRAGLRAYRLAIGEEEIFRYFANTFMVAFSTALLLPLITFPASWVIAGGSARTGAFILVSIQIIGTVSGMHALIPLYIIFRSLGIINTYASLILIYLEHSFVFSLYTMSAFLRDLPSSLREAAVLEGAGPFYYLRKILLPLSRPVVLTAMIVAFLGAWNGFLPALLFIRDDWKYTIGVKIYTFVGSIASGSPRWSIFAATSVINLLFLVILFGIMIRRGGVTALSDVEE